MIQKIFPWIGSLLLFVGAIQQFFVNDFFNTSFIATIVLGFLAYYSKEKYLKIISIILIALNWIGTIINSWSFINFSALATIILGLYLLVTSAKKLWKTKGKYITKGLWTIIGVVSLLISLAISTVTIFPDQSFSYIRSVLKMSPDKIETQQSESKTPNGDRVVSNIQYDTQVENGFLDIYYSNKATSDKPLTVIYIHGGGYLWGDKVGGDPNAGTQSFDSSFIANMLDEGYNVISMNYALTPTHRYPTAIKQLNRGLAYLKTNADKLNINMDSVVLSGGSAGGNLAGVLTNIQTNPEYAAKINESATLPADNIKSVILEGPLLDNGRFQVTHSPIVDWAFYQMGRIYFDANDINRVAELSNSNVLEHVTKEFPPTFISDGNSATFYDQAFDLDKKLTDLGVKHELSYYTIEEAGILGHGFEESGSPYAIKTMDKIKNFIRSVNK